MSHIGPSRHFAATQRGIADMVGPAAGLVPVENDPKRHFARVAKGLFDHVIGNRAHRRWHLDAECSRSLKIDDELEFGRL